MATNRKNAKKTPIFLCEKCDFKCCKESDYSRHLETNKHRLLTNANKKPPKNADGTKQPFVCICGNVYKFASSLCYHKKKCSKYNSSENMVSDIISDLETAHVLTSDNCDLTKDMFIKLMNDNQEMMKIIKEQQQQLNTIIPKIGGVTNNTTNNHFNLNLFLNEKCKDALNISEFIDSLKITLDDLAFSKDNGLVRGIADVMIRGLKDLDVHKRPIHCTDSKRDIMYIKDKEKWEKDDGNVKLKESIDTLSKKQMYTLKELRDSDPEIKTNDDKRDKFIVTMNHVTTPITETGGKKMIKTIGKEIFIDKELDAA